MMREKFQLHDVDFVDLFEGEDLIFSGDGREFKKLLPTWNGIFALGDIITVNGIDRQIVNIEINYPNDGEISTKYKITIK